MQEVKVWDFLVRILHWSLVGGVIGAWITREGDDILHAQFGYVVLGIVVARIIWGFIGFRHARFVDFVRSPRETIAYLRSIITHRERRYVGHNPLGGWMILALLATITGICVTGWLNTTDAYWGVAWVGELHASLTDLLIGLVTLHIVGVVFTSIRQRENLVKAMVTGTKRAPEPGLKAD
jgi:cytochrome b